jgi:hypothetical protein
MDRVVARLAGLERKVEYLLRVFRNLVPGQRYAQQRLRELPQSLFPGAFTGAGGGLAAFGLVVKLTSNVTPMNFTTSTPGSGTAVPQRFAGAVPLVADAGSLTVFNVTEKTILSGAFVSCLPVLDVTGATQYLAAVVDKCANLT